MERKKAIQFHLILSLIVLTGVSSTIIVYFSQLLGLAVGTKSATELQMVLSTVVFYVGLAVVILGWIIIAIRAKYNYWIFLYALLLCIALFLGLYAVRVLPNLK